MPYEDGDEFIQTLKTEPHRPSPRRGLLGWTVLVLVLLIGAGVSTWFFMQPEPAKPTATSSSTGPGTFTVSGTVILSRGQFTWVSSENPTCNGFNGFDDIRGGGQVTVTDASGKTLAVGSISRGNAEGITTETDGTHRAAICPLPFSVLDVPRGVGPYGVKITHRGTLTYTEDQLIASLTLEFD